MGAADREIGGPLSLTFKPRPEEVREEARVSVADS